MVADLRPELAEFRSAIRAWITANVPAGLADVFDWTRPVIGAMDRAAHDRAADNPLHQEWEHALLAEGLVCPHWPRRYGGSDWDAARTSIFAEECHRAGLPRITRAMGEELVGPALLSHGTPEQKDHFLPRIVRGEDVYCQGFSEPGSGSDLASLRTRGRVDGEQLVVSGQKIWTSLADSASTMFTLCRTEPDSTRHRGISYVLVDLDQPGVEIRPIPQITGRAEFCEVFLDDVRAPLFNVVGGLGAGWRVAMTTLGAERGGRASVQHLDFERELSDLLLTARRTGALADPLTRQRLAWALAQVEVLRMEGHRMVAGSLRGLDPATGKLRWSEYQRAFGDLVAHVAGAGFAVRPDGDGYALDTWQDIYLASRADTIYAGTSQIQRNLIAERVLGMPREGS